MPAFRLPLELELHILELATPPLLLDRVRQRVKFLRRIALVHRSFTKWAQDKLREQFVFTFRARVGEQKRLQERLTAGFESPSSGKLLRLYLDLRAWDRDGDWALDQLDDLSDEESGIEPPRRGEKPGASGQALEDVRVWRPLDILRPWLSKLNRTYLLPAFELDLEESGPVFSGSRYLEIDDHAFKSAPWEELDTVLPESLTTLVLRDISAPDTVPLLPNLRHFVVIRSSIDLLSIVDIDAFPALEVFESIASEPAFHPDNLAFFRPLAHTVRFYQTDCPEPTTDNPSAYETPPPLPPRLETCTFTWLAASPVASAARDPLDKLRAALVERTGKPPLTVKCIRSKATEEEMIERVLAGLVV